MSAESSRISCAATSPCGSAGSIVTCRIDDEVCTRSEFPPQPVPDRCCDRFLPTPGGSAEFAPPKCFFRQRRRIDARESVESRLFVQRAEREQRFSQQRNRRVDERHHFAPAFRIEQHLVLKYHDASVAFVNAY